MRWLVALEIVGVVGFVGMAAVSLFDRADPLPAIDVAALATGPSQESWTGIFLDAQHIGYAMSRESPAEGGGRIWETQSAIKIGSMGEVQQIVSAGAALTDAQGQLVRFDFLMSSPVRIIASGEARPGGIHVELTQAGETTPIDIPMDKPPVLSMTLKGALGGRVLTTGQSFKVPYFDPITMTNAQMSVLVEAPEKLANGEDAWWVRTSFGSVSARRLVDGDGDVLREESEMGFSSVRMTKQQAMAVDEADPPDLVALASVPVTGVVRRGARTLALRVSGVPASRVAEEEGLQVVTDDVVRVTVPAIETLPSLPIRGDSDLDVTPTLPANHVEIVAKAESLVVGAQDRREAAQRIAGFVHDYVAKMPTIGVPNGLEVLRTGRGDCNEHTALFVTLARAVGIPSRIAAGLVWSDRLGDAFYYHAWPEVLLGDGTAGVRWVPIDPTFGQFPADATHVKLLNGDLDRQVEIMGVMGRIRLEVVD